MYAHGHLIRLRLMLMGLVASALDCYICCDRAGTVGRQSASYWGDEATYRLGLGVFYCSIDLVHLGLKRRPPLVVEMFPQVGLGISFSPPRGYNALYL